MRLAWLTPPRYLVALFVAVTVVPCVLLMVFGWRLFQQDRELERQQIESDRDQTADISVAALEQAVLAAEQTLRAGRPLPGVTRADDVVVMQVTAGRLESYLAGRLLYSPAPDPGVEAAPAVYAPGERLEHEKQDPAGAAAWFRARLPGQHGSARAGALIRLARNLRKAGHPDDALAVYAEAARGRGTAVAGVPSDLLARWARCDLLEAAGRTSDLRREAASLRDDLLSGAWPIGRATFDGNLADTERWLGSAVPVPPIRAALASAADAFWRESGRAASDGRASSGRTLRIVDGIPITIVWSAEPPRFTALLAGPSWVRQHWLAKLAPMLDRQHADVAIRDPAIRPIAGETRRTAADTGLPWTIVVERRDRNATGVRPFGRRAPWLAAFGVLSLLIVAGTYVVGRAVARELAVARLQSDFVAAVSHEFRTPLTSLRQLSEMLVDRPDLPPDRRATYYAAIARQTDRLHRLVESLLNFGRMEAGTSPYSMDRLDVRALVTDIVEQFRAAPAARGHQIHLHVNGTDATVSADREALTTAVWNLLDNATKYSPASPAVWVAVERVASDVAIRVRDDGIGVPVDEQREIFGKFVRGARARAEHIQGTGLGLAMVQYIAAAHRGDVAVESAPGAGSTFTLRLPIEEPCRAS